mgnify:CR=1 FL=1
MTPNRWYGLGSIYLRQEKYQLAEYHYRRALAINPQNPILYCQLGAVLHKTKKNEEALRMLCGDELNAALSTATKQSKAAKQANQESVG